MLGLTEIFDGTLAPVTGVAITNTAFSTNTLDLLVGRDLGTADLLGIHVDILTAFTGGTSLQIAVNVSADNVTFFQTQLTPVYPQAQLIAGSPIARIGLEPNQLLNATAGILKAPGRYVKLQYIVVGPFTGGTVFSYLNPSKDRQLLYNYPANYTAAVQAGQI